MPTFNRASIVSYVWVILLLVIVLNFAAAQRGAFAAISDKDSVVTNGGAGIIEIPASYGYALEEIAFLKGLRAARAASRGFGGRSAGRAIGRSMRATRVTRPTRIQNFSAELGRSKSSARRTLRRNLQLGSSRRQAHHVVPLEMNTHPVVVRAARGGFNINGIENGIGLKNHGGSHPAYSKRVRETLDGILEATKGKRLKDWHYSATLKRVILVEKKKLLKMDKSGRKLSRWWRREDHKLADGSQFVDLTYVGNNIADLKLVDCFVYARTLCDGFLHRTKTSFRIEALLTGGVLYLHPLPEQQDGEDEDLTVRVFVPAWIDLFEFPRENDKTVDEKVDQTVEALSKLIVGTAESAGLKFEYDVIG